MSKFQSIILNRNIIPNKEYSSLLENNGVLWVITEHTYKNDICQMNPYDMIDYFQEKENLYLRTIIVWINSNQEENSFMTNRYKYILMFSKEKDFYFTKDPIREKHKWAHLDWGKRKHRYHPLGKDPGTVWITVLDDGKGKTIGHKTLTEKDVYKRLVLSTTKENDKVYLDKSIDIEVEGREYTIEETQDKINIFKTVVSNNKVTEKTNINLTEEVKYIIHNQSSEDMKNVVEDESVQTIVTSPPYWDLKNYKNNNQIGYKESYEEYHNRLNKVWNECYRVLKKDGSIFINVNTLTKNKNMILIQKDIIKHMQSIGFILKDVIIWTKPSGIPNPNLLSDHFEYIMWFVKDINSYKVYNHELPKDYLVEGLEGNGNVWSMFRKAGNIAKKLPHPAIYPNELVNRCVLLTTKEGDTILDPFLGSGTSLIESINLSRSFIGFEINLDYMDIIQHRIDNEIQ